MTGSGDEMSAYGFSLREAEAEADDDDPSPATSSREA